MKNTIILCFSISAFNRKSNDQIVRRSSVLHFFFLASQRQRVSLQKSQSFSLIPERTHLSKIWRALFPRRSQSPAPSPRFCGSTLHRKVEPSTRTSTSRLVSAPLISSASPVLHPLSWNKKLINPLVCRAEILKFKSINSAPTESL